MYQDQPCSSSEIIQRFFQIPWCLESREISSLMSETSRNSTALILVFSYIKSKTFPPSALWPQHKQSEQPLKFLPAAMFLRYGYTYSPHACIFHVLLITTSLVNLPSACCIGYCYLINCPSPSQLKAAHISPSFSEVRISVQPSWASASWSHVAAVRVSVEGL